MRFSETIFERCNYLWFGKPSSRGLVVRVLDSGLNGHGFDPHTGHGSLLKLRQFHLGLPQFASVYSAAN